MTMNKTRGSAQGDGMTLAPFECLTDAALRDIQRVYDALPPTREKMDVLFSVDAAQTAPSDAWIGFFVETICAQLVWDERPTGTLLLQDAAFVLAKFDDAPTLASLALMVRLIEEAQTVPSTFVGDVRRRASLFTAAAAERSPQTVKRTSVPYLRLVA